MLSGEVVGVRILGVCLGSRLFSLVSPLELLKKQLISIIFLKEFYSLYNIYFLRI